MFYRIYRSCCYRGLRRPWSIRFAGGIGIVAVVAMMVMARPVQAGCDNFPTYEEITQQLFTYASTYPNLCQVDVIGTSVAGRDLYRVRLSDHPEDVRQTPEIRIIGGIHGNECQSVDEVMRIIDWLLTGYNSDEERQRFLSGIVFYLLPLVNPDGYSAEPVATRVNANGVDLNRNFGFGFSERNLFSPFSEPESRAIRDFSQQHAFVLGLSYHTEAGYVNGPWNYTPFHPRDDELIDTIGYDYAGNSDYDVVFGWDWYQISGDVNDWSLGTMGTFDWTIELTDSNDPVWDVHEPGLRAFFNWAFRGVQGDVVDAKSGEPIQAMITVEPEGAPVFTHPVLGGYHRLLLDGEYEITAWAPGYHPLTIENVRVANDMQTVDFGLSRDPAFSAAYQVTGTTLPRDISNAYVDLVGYDNDTVASDALGPPDGYGYSLSAGGTITVDMGSLQPVVDVPGMDLRIVSATGSDDTVRVSVAEYQDGPFVEVAAGSGNLDMDVQYSGMTQIRFVRITDETTGVNFNEAASGYDLDAVVNLSDAILNGNAKTQTDDSASETDQSDTDSQSDAAQIPRVQATTGAKEIYGCTMILGGASPSLLRLL
ncbi:MAG: hypothetical protein JXX14_11530 [Deltaproteobacteria bacterium]|nr:hypothetical protein [Deltaproteobacteria bacterium]